MCPRNQGLRSRWHPDHLQGAGNEPRGNHVSTQQKKKKRDYRYQSVVRHQRTSRKIRSVLCAPSVPADSTEESQQSWRSRDRQPTVEAMYGVEGLFYQKNRSSNSYLAVTSKRRTFGRGRVQEGGMHASIVYRGTSIWTKYTVPIPYRLPRLFVASMS